MAPFIFWNLAFYTIIRTQLEKGLQQEEINGIKQFGGLLK
ncbi:LexA repressor-like protein [Paenibacillus larvae subsp. larvae DSM 25430]|nr:LexA repressor-like protein [Paenibacillus larvae subsp. larvae DSM 25430]